MSPKPTKSLFAKPFEKVWSSWNLFDWGLRRAGDSKNTDGFLRKGLYPKEEIKSLCLEQIVS